ncbi:MAG: SDR family NAD(P)-dependent oxidoreductase [Cyanobacteriota bacterium]
MQSLLIQGNVSQEADVVNRVQQVIQRWGCMDILVNNAGIQTKRPAHEISLEEYDRILNVNLRGSFFYSRKALKHAKPALRMF